MTQRLTTILRPDAKRTVVHLFNIDELQAKGEVNPFFRLPAPVSNKKLPSDFLYLASEFVAVPTVETYGTWRILDLLPVEQVAALARFGNKLEKRGRRVARSR